MSGRPDRTTLRTADVRVGDELPEMIVDVTATVVVAGAIATRDFMPVHHDRAYAEEQGSPEIFMNILSDTAYCSRFITDWAGPEAMIRKLAIRLGAPAYAGSTLVYSGRVTAISSGSPGEDTLVSVELTATNSLGAHVSGTAVVGLPN
jgi:acyl dehydratase